eukprot:scaffold3393_cov101-Isochrysis_galbana.AAC.10
MPSIPNLKPPPAPNHPVASDLWGLPALAPPWPRPRHAPCRQPSIGNTGNTVHPLQAAPQPHSVCRLCRAPTSSPNLPLIPLCPLARASPDAAPTVPKNRTRIHRRSRGVGRGCGGGTTEMRGAGRPSGTALVRPGPTCARRRRRIPSARPAGGPTA